MKSINRISKGSKLLTLTVLFAGAAFSLPRNAAAETPQVVNAKMETRAVGSSLAETFRGLEAQADKPEWVGYSVPEIPGDRTVCCGNFNDNYGTCGTCRLEKENGFTSTSSKNDAETGTVQLEGSRQLVVL